MRRVVRTLVFPRRRRRTSAYPPPPLRTAAPFVPHTAGPGQTKLGIVVRSDAESTPLLTQARGRILGPTVTSAESDGAAQYEAQLPVTRRPAAQRHLGHDDASNAKALAAVATALTSQLRGALVRVGERAASENEQLRCVDEELQHFNTEKRLVAAAQGWHDDDAFDAAVAGAAENAAALSDAAVNGSGASVATSYIMYSGAVAAVSNMRKIETQLQQLQQRLRRAVRAMPLVQGQPAVIATVASVGATQSRSQCPPPNTIDPAISTDSYAASVAIRADKTAASGAVNISATHSGTVLLSADEMLHVGTAGKLQHDGLAGSGVDVALTSTAGSLLAAIAAVAFFCLAVVKVRGVARIPFTT